MNDTFIITISDILGVATFVIGFISVVFVGIQIWQKFRMDHSKQVLDMLNKTRSEQDMAELLYQLDYNKFHYDAYFHGSQTERLVDNVLHYYEYILYLRDINIINKKEFQFFEYDIQRIVCNQDMQSYFFTLYHFVKNKLSFKYQRLLKYGRKNGWIGADFDNSDSRKYTKGVIIDKNK